MPLPPFLYIGGSMGMLMHRTLQELENKKKETVKEEIKEVKKPAKPKKK